MRASASKCVPTPYGGISDLIRTLFIRMGCGMDGTVVDAKFSMRVQRQDMLNTLRLRTASSNLKKVNAESVQQALVVGFDVVQLVCDTKYFSNYFSR
jgi:hypothetical protein